MSLPTVLPKRDAVLTSFATEFKNQDFVGDTIFPIIETDSRSVRYGMLDKLNLFQSVDDTLARDGEANEVGMGASVAMERLRNFALKTTITNEDLEDAENFVSQAMDQVDVMRRTLALRREIRQAGLLFSALDGASRSVDPGNITDYSASAIDLLTSCRTVTDNALYPFTHAVIPKQVLNYVQRHPSLLAAYFNGTSGQKILSKEQIAELIGVPDILVPNARYSTARRPTVVTSNVADFASVWGPHIFFLRVSPTVPNRMDPGCAYQFRRRWTKGQVGDNMQVRTWMVPQKGIGGSYVVQQEYQALDKVLSTEMGYVLKNVLS